MRNATIEAGDRAAALPGVRDLVPAHLVALLGRFGVE
jgi:hypothetical protein